MDVFYRFAEGVVSTAQAKSSGGLFAFALEHLADSFVLPQSLSSPPVSTHFANTISSGGFLAGLFFGLFWCIGLLIGSVYLCWLRLPKNKSCANTCKHSDLESSKKSRLFLRRRQMQSNCTCIAFQFFVFATMVGLLLLVSILGFLTSLSLHASLVAEPPKESQLQNATTVFNNEGLFPSLTSALLRVRMFITDFLDEVRINTQPAVDNLIQATVEMQNKTTLHLNSLLFQMLNIDRAFELGDKLGAHTVRLLNLVIPLKSHLLEYTDTVSSLSMAIARWNGYMEQLHMEKNLTEMKSCEANADCHLPILAKADLTVSSNWRLPQFDFVIALNFVTDAQNRTPDVIEEQLKTSRLLAARQMEKTLMKMETELDIPVSLQNLTEETWRNIALSLNSFVATLDNITGTLPKKYYPLAVVGSSYIVSVFCLIWLAMIAIAFGISMLAYHFHFVNAAIKSHNRKKIRCITAFVLIILVLCILVSCMTFLVSGYAYTEMCRYISPNQAVTEESSYGSVNETSFILDTHVNRFLDRNWDRIVEGFNKVTNHSVKDKLPIPRIKSPIYALNVGCKKNTGILDAFGAVETFNYSVLNKPEMTNEFIVKGREIMRETLRDLNMTEMFPPALTESVQLASRLDDFLIPFDKVRKELPRDFLNVTSQNRTMLMSGTQLSELWQEYFTFLKQSNLSLETLARADELAGNVFNLSSKIITLLDSVDESLQNLATIQKIGSTVSELQGIFDTLVDRLRNRDALIKDSLELYDKHVAADLPGKVDEIIGQYGPPLLREVAKCRQLYDAYDVGVTAVCGSVVAPLNGIWLFAGLNALLSTLLILLGLFLLLHKIPPFPHATTVDRGEPLHLLMQEQSVKSNQTLSSVNGVRVVQPPGIHSLVHKKGSGGA